MCIIFIAGDISLFYIDMKCKNIHMIKLFKYYAQTSDNK